MESLPPEERALFRRIFEVSAGEGWLRLPEEMSAVKRGALRDHEVQTIVRVTNRITGESTLFNGLRAGRPHHPGIGELRPAQAAGGDCPFCRPLEETPEDTFGRIRGRHSVTASNLAKYDRMHGIIIFDEHDPLLWDEDRIRDYLEVAERWFRMAREEMPEARYPFFMWNCLWRAGASIEHGHAQVLLSAAPYRALTMHQEAVSSYASRYGSEYGRDLYLVHRMLGLATEAKGAWILAHLTPLKENEALILSESSAALPEAIQRVLSTYLEAGIRSFNLAIWMPPLDGRGMHLVRIVDRGDLASPVSDIGGMELLAWTPVVAGDPFRLMRLLSRSGDPARS